MATVSPAAKESFLGKLTETVYLDYALRAVGIAGFVWSFLNAWHSLGLGVRAGMLASVAAWFVGERFSRIYR